MELERVYSFGLISTKKSHENKNDMAISEPFQKINLDEVIEEDTKHIEESNKKMEDQYNLNQDNSNTNPNNPANIIINKTLNMNPFIIEKQRDFELFEKQFISKHDYEMMELQKAPEYLKNRIPIIDSPDFNLQNISKSNKALAQNKYEILKYCKGGKTPPLLKTESFKYQNDNTPKSSKGPI